VYDEDGRQRDKLPVACGDRTFGLKGLEWKGNRNMMESGILAVHSVQYYDWDSVKAFGVAGEAIRFGGYIVIVNSPQVALSAVLLRPPMTRRRVMQSAASPSRDSCLSNDLILHESLCPRAKTCMTIVTKS